MSMPSPHALPVAPAGSGIEYRRYTGFEDLPGMAAANARLRLRSGIVEAVDLEVIRHRYEHLVNSDPVVDCVIALRDGATVGYGRAEWHDLTDGDRIYQFTSVVEPAAWDLGINDALVVWSEGRLREIAGTHESRRRAWFGSVAFDGDTELAGVLRARGYEAVRWDAEMFRETMEDLPPVGDLPPGYEIRPVTEDRLYEVHEMLAAAFRDHWGEHEQDDDEFRDWIEDPHFDLDLVVVVWHGDDPVACVSSQIQTAPDGTPLGYLDAAATLPHHRRLGLARVAFAENLRRLAVAGVRRAYLGVDTDNEHRAFALYEEAGFRRVSAIASYRKPFDGQETRT
jgi:ribosomal protein S18 acetylase RimI-like enzyme